MVLVIGELAISMPSLRVFCAKREYYSSAGGLVGLPDNELA